MKMQRNKIKIYLVFVMLLFGCVLFFSLKDDFKDIVYNLMHINLIWVIVGIVFVFLSKYFIGLTTYDLAIKENKNISKSKMQQIALIYPFYAGITPSSVGGEAFEIFYLKQCGLSFGWSSNMQMQKFILFQISLVIVNTLALVINFFSGIIVDSAFVGSAVTINYVVIFAMLGGCFLITYNTWVKNFILQKGVLFLSKIKVIKDVDKSKDKIDDFVKKFDDGAKALYGDSKLFWKLVIYNVLSLLFLFLAAYPIALAFHINSISVIDAVVISIYVKMMCLLVVTPGTSGAAEYCFVYLFNGLIPESDIMAYMLIWRFVTYYIPLVTGGIIALSWERRKYNEKIVSTES